jgi:hypothetical protein
MSSSGSAVDKTYKMLIGGEWVLGDEGTTPIINPATEEIVGYAPEASVAQAEAAAQAAQDAFPKWWRTPPAERARLLQALADTLRERQGDLVPLIISETGATAMVGSRMQVPVAIERFERYALISLSRRRQCKRLRLPLVVSSVALFSVNQLVLLPVSRPTTSQLSTWQERSHPHLQLVAQLS